ncbi:MAG: GNAT family N-acetyltransferase, partial [Candidatus Binatia bacterium]
GYPMTDFVVRHGAPLGEPSFVHQGFQNTLSITYVIDAREREGWKARLSKNHRYYLRKAEEQRASEPWEVLRGASADEAWTLLQATGGRKGFRLEVSRERFESSIGRLLERGAAEIWSLVDASGRTVSAALLARDDRFAYYLASGMRPGLRRDFLGNYVLLQAMIDDTLQRGLSFDFEGSVLPGVEPFFRGFGGEIRYNVRQVRISSVLVYVIWAASRYRNARRRVE